MSKDGKKEQKPTSSPEKKRDKPKPGQGILIDESDRGRGHSPFKGTDTTKKKS